MKYFLSVISIVLPLSSWAQPVPSQYIDKALKADIEKILVNDVVIDSIRNQNDKHVDLKQEDVDALDQLWRKQTKEKDKYFISAVLANPLSSYLTRIQAHSKGKFLEIFVMDDKGLNVGQSSISSDYWQGDEGKWQKTYLKGVGSVFVDEAEYNKESNIWSAQYNVAIEDPESKKVIGAATFELNLTELARLKGEKL